MGALDQTVPTFLCCPFLSGFSTVFFYYLLVLYRAVTQNVQPARTFLLYTYMTACGLLARERARRRASARAERAIKKNWPLSGAEIFCDHLPNGSNTTCA